MSRRKPKKPPPPAPPPPVPIDAYGRSDSTFTVSPPTVEPQPEQADKQRRHFFRWLTVQNIGAALAVIVTIVGSYYQLQSQVNVQAKEIESLKRQQHATWERLDKLRPMR